MSPPASDPQAKALAALLKRLAEQHAPAPPAEDGAAAPVGTFPPPPTLAIDPAEPVLAEFVWSFLLWESTTALAAVAMKRLGATVVDFNELRVCLPDELVRILGERYPRAAERAQRLRAALNEIFAREHAVTLEHLATQNKRDARAYLDSLDGVPPFVSARVALSLGSHAAPVDERMLHRLVHAGIVGTDADVESAAGALSHRIRAGELAQAYLLLQAWAEHEPEPAPVADGGEPIVSESRRTTVDSPPRAGAKRQPNETGGTTKGTKSGKAGSRD